MGNPDVRFGRLDLPLIVSGGERRLRLYLGEIKGAGAGPNIVKQASGSKMLTFMVEDAQQPAGQLAPGGAFDADLEPEALAHRDCGRQAPDVHARLVSHCCEG